MTVLFENQDSDRRFSQNLSTNSLPEEAQNQTAALGADQSVQRVDQSIEKRIREKNALVASLAQTFPQIAQQTIKDFMATLLDAGVEKRSAPAYKEKTISDALYYLESAYTANLVSQDDLTAFVLKAVRTQKGFLDWDDQEIVNFAKLDFETCAPAQSHEATPPDPKSQALDKEKPLAYNQGQISNLTEGTSASFRKELYSMLTDQENQDAGLASEQISQNNSPEESPLQAPSPEVATNASPLPSKEEIVAAAKYYASLGYAVIPVRSKTLYDKDGNMLAEVKKAHLKWSEATTDPTQIEKWFLYQFPNAMIGIMLREDDLCIDIDRHEGGNDGFKTLQEWEAKYGKLPKTFTYESPNNGEHLILKKPANFETKNKDIAPGIEALSKNKMLIMPPSINYDLGKAYTIDVDAPIAPAPDWLLKLAAKPAPAPRPAYTPTIRQTPISDKYFAPIWAECDALARLDKGSREQTMCALALKLGSLCLYIDTAESAAILDSCMEQNGFVADPHHGGPDKVKAKIRAKIAEGAKNPRIIQDKRPALSWQRGNADAMPKMPDMPEPPIDSYTEADAYAPIDYSQDAPEPVPNTAKQKKKAGKKNATKNNGKMYFELGMDDAETIVDKLEPLLRPYIYQQNGSLLRVVPGDPQEVLLDDGTLRFEKSAAKNINVSQDVLIKLINKVACFFVKSKKIIRFVNIPQNVLSEMFGRVGTGWQLDWLAGIANTPQITMDGKVLANHGYDQYSRLHCAFDPHDYRKAFVHITKSDAAQMAMEALGFLNKTIDEFPFVSKTDKAVAIAAMLSTAICMTAPKIPMFGFSSPSPRTGKSTLADLISIIATGFPAAVVNYEKDEASFQKRLLAPLLSGRQVRVIDNLDGPFNTAFLDSLLSQRALSVRKLYDNMETTLSGKGIWLATGNNIVITQDLTGRSLLCELDRNEETPRTHEFRVKRFYDTMIRARYDLMSAVIIIVRAFFILGMPSKNDITPLVNYEYWSDIIRGILIWLLDSDPLESQKTIEKKDFTRANKALVFHTWFEKFNGKKLTIRDIREQEEYSGLLDVFKEIITCKETPTTKQIAKWLLDNKAPLDGLELVVCGEIDRRQAYLVTTKEEAEKIKKEFGE